MAITPVPSMTDTPAFPSLADRAAGTYNSKAYDFGNHMSNTFNAELEAVAQSAYANAQAAEQGATDAEAAATDAQSAATSAAATAGATKWVSGSYAEGVAVWSPTDGQTYRRKAPGGASPTDPALDPTNWYAVGSPATLANKTLTTPTITGGTLTNTVVNEGKGANIASAATVNLDTATGNLVHITGTTTITAITLASGAERDVVFDGALTLTHNATTLILPGGANITTAAGDRATFRGDGTGNVRCMHYTKADGSAIVGGATVGNLVQLSRATPAGVAAVDFTSLITSTYDEYVLDILNLYPANNGVQLHLRTSTNNGSAYDTGGYEYAVMRVMSGSSSVNGSNGSSAGQISLTGDGNITNPTDYGGVSMRVRIIRPTAAQICHMSWHGGYAASTGGISLVSGHGARFTTSDVDAIRLFFSSGNVAAGTVILYGVKK